MKQWSETLAKRRESKKMRGRGRGYFPARCQKCEARRTFKYLYDLKAAKCRACKHPILRLDKFRASRRESHGNNCQCERGRWAGPHRRGWCTHMRDPLDEREEWERSCTP